MGRYVSFMDGGKTDEVGLFHFLLKTHQTGWLYGNSVTQRGAGANMSVDVTSGQGWLIATSTAVFPAYIDATENVTVDAADPTNPRKDILVAYIDLAVRSAASSNNPGALKFKAVAGTPAGSPSDPSDPTIQTAVGAGNPYVKLRRIAVAAADTTIVNADITDISVPAAYTMPYLKGGASNTNGHLVPNAADDTLVLANATQTLANKTINASQLVNASIATAKLADDSVTDDKLDYPRFYAEIGRTTLGSAGDTITVSSLPARKYIKILISALDTGGSIDTFLRFNNDTGSNYARRISVNGAADNTAGTSQSGLALEGGSTSSPIFVVVEIVNIAASEKLVIAHSNNRGTAGAGNVPGRQELVGKWANTTDQITRVDVVNISGSGDYAIGSQVIVLGHD